MMQHPDRTRHNILALFAAGLVQGAGLYAIRHALEHLPEDAVVPTWIGATLAVAVLLPLAAQLMSEHLRQRRAWVALAGLSVLLGAFGVQQLTGVGQQHAVTALWTTAFLIHLWMSLALPFLQSWLQEGRWWPQYPSLFITAWRNHLLLAQAAVFLGLFWGLLGLAVGLFSLIGLDQAQRFIFSSAFTSIVSPLAFAAGLYLSRHSPRRTATLMEMVLTPLTWLALLAGVILLVFTPLLMFRLPGLLSSGQRIISAYALLSLVCATVLFINAAFRDGRSDTVFPRWIASALRAVMPLMLVVSMVALYAMYLRVDGYGLTVSRAWGLLAAGTAVLYGIGYTIAAARPGPWMAGIATSNTVIACVVIVVLGLMYTPLLSPQRLAANSQFERALRLPLDELQQGDSPMYALMRTTGRYGRERLQALAELQDHPDAAGVRHLAADLLSGRRQSPDLQPATLAGLDTLPIHPAGQALAPSDVEQIRQGLLAQPHLLLANVELRGGVFIDLDDDGRQEFILLHDTGAVLFERHADAWRFVAPMYSDAPQAPPAAITEAIERGEVHLYRPRWAGVEVGGWRLEVMPWQMPPISIDPGQQPATDQPADPQ